MAIPAEVSKEMGKRVTGHEICRKTWEGLKKKSY